MITIVAIQKAPPLNNTFYLSLIGYWLIPFTTLILTNTVANATFKDPNDVRTAILANQNNLAKIQRLADQLAKAYSKSEQQLKDSEQAIAANFQKILAAQQLQQQLQQQISQLQQQTADLENQKKNQQQQLHLELKRIYQNGSHSTVKQWFNQQDPELLQRLLYYQHYLQQARLQKLQRYQHTLQEYSATEHNLVQAQQALINNNQELLSQQEQLEQQHQQRQLFIKQLQKKNQKTSQAFTQLQNEHNDLQKLLEKLLQTRAAQRQKQAEKKRTATGLSTDNNLASNSRKPNTLKGKLLWPTQGTVTSHFGSPRGGVDLVWKGIFIDASEGEKVHAVEAGEIIFASWLRGYGLLCIIDHGNDLLTLYGHNKVITRKIGETVQANDVIAKIGNSGGLVQSGLYFEVRQQGKAINPLVLLKN